MQHYPGIILPKFGEKQRDDFINVAHGGTHQRDAEGCHYPLTAHSTICINTYHISHINIYIYIIYIYIDAYV